MDIKDNSANTPRPSNIMVPDTGAAIPPPDFDIPGSPSAIAEQAIPDKKEERKQPSSPLQDSLRRLRRDKRAMVSLIVLAFFIILPLIGPSIYQRIGGIYESPTNGTIGPQVYHDYTHIEVTRQNEGPSGQYWLGTDNLGHDLLARLMQGMLISLAVAILVEIVDVVLGVIIGVLAGFYGGIIDQLLARFTDLMFAFPGLLFVILLTGIFGPATDETLGKIPVIGANGNARLLLVSLALAFTVWPLMARYVRGQTLQLKEQQFIEAARTSGTSDFRIITRHIIPNLFSLVFIASTLNISGTIISEAGISLLGLGVQPPGSSIGLMIADSTEYIEAAAWPVIMPTIALTIIVLAFTFLGDGLRDAFDPRSKD